jgi:surfactin synthase thioesterase subunit
MSEDQFETWQQRLESAVAAYTLKRTKRNKERAEMAERRMYGLMQRHARKLARRPPDKP